ncbi:MAG: triose-phosphate isomerase [Pseudomonadota bacterium]
MPKIVAGNWKMNGLREGGRALATALAELAKSDPPGCEVVVCPPAQLLLPVGEALAGSPIALGAQTCHDAASGAHTGDISAQMLADAGCSHVIVGHSERRQDHGESDAAVRAKASAAQSAGLTPIVCVGETAQERADGQTLAVIDRQIGGSLPDDPDFVVAYEPVWAIGSGQRAEPDDIVAVHRHIRDLLKGADNGILYGGSVKASNATELFGLPEVDGALVGGASLKAEEFWNIVNKLG